MHEIDNGLDDNSWNARLSVLPKEFHNNSWVVTKGIEFIKIRDKTRPYFLNSSFHRPHPPLDPPLSFWNMYMSKELEEIPTGNRVKKYEKNIKSCVNGVGEGCWKGKLSHERLRRARLPYYAQIAHIKINKNIDRLDLSPLLQKGGRIKGEWIHGEHSACYSKDETMQFITDGKFKYIWFTNTNEELLFDLIHNPYECKNLSANIRYNNELLKWRNKMIYYLKDRKKDNLSDEKKLIINFVQPYRTPNQD